MIVGDHDTGDKFFAGINYSGEQLSPVTMTPAITFFPGVVNTDTDVKFFGGVNHTGD
jgi:hypothetical protein